MSKYSKQFKVEALKLSDEIGVKNAAEQLGLPYYTLAGWRNRTRAKIEGEAKSVNVVEREERLHELEKENEELRHANDALREAIVFLAKDRKK